MEGGLRILTCNFFVLGMDKISNDIINNELKKKKPKNHKSKYFLQYSKLGHSTLCKKRPTRIKKEILDEIKSINFLSIKHCGPVKVPKYQLLNS